MKTIIYYGFFALSVYVSLTLGSNPDPDVNFIPRLVGMFAIPLTVAKILHDASKV